MAIAMMIGYLMVTMFIGLSLLKKNSGIAEYLVAKRNMGAFLVAALLFGELLSGASSVGKATEGFNSGFSAVWINWGAALGCSMAVVFGVTKLYRVFGEKKGIMSVPEAYRLLFDQKTSIVMLVILVLVYGIIFSLQPLAAASILGPMFRIDIKIMAIIVGLILTAITFSGGLRGLATMNVVHASVMFFGMAVVAVSSVNHAGGWYSLADNLPNSYFSFLQPDIWTVIAWALGTAFSFLCAASLAGTALGAKNEGAANKGIIWASIMVIPYAIMPALIGMAAKVAYPDMNPATALFSMANAVSPMMGGIVSIAVIAAIFSTAPSLILIVSTVLTRDFYKGILNPEATDRQQLVFSRSLVIIIGLFGTLLGMNATSILNTALGAFQIRAFAGVILIIMLFWPRVTKDAAFWSLLVGGSLAAIWHFAGNPFGIQPLWPSFGVGLILLMGLTLLSKEKVSEGYKTYQECLEEYNKEQEAVSEAE